MKKILIIQTAFLGDVILATPLIEKLKMLHPAATIDFLVRKGNEAVLDHHPFLDHIHIWNKKKHKLRNLFRLMRIIRKERYDGVINLHRFFSSGLITVFSGARFTSGFNKNPLSFLFSYSVKHVIGQKEPALHEVQRNLLLLGMHGIPAVERPRLYPSDSHFAKTKPYKTNPYICVAPASVWFTKQFAVEKWIEFIDCIQTETVYLLGSSDDQKICMQIQQQSANKKIIDLSGKLTILETAALMKDAKMNYVNDSAPLHIASAMNAKVTAVFCSTIPAFGFGPLSEHSVVIETTEQLSCKPCGLHGFRSCPQQHFNCAYTIKKEQLLNQIL